jgi:hypothetical protein
VTNGGLIVELDALLLEAERRIENYRGLPNGDAANEGIVLAAQLRHLIYRADEVARRTLANLRAVA